MSITCTRCEGTGFLNYPGVSMDSWTHEEFWNKFHNQPGFELMEICDCCGDGTGWHGIPGEHYNDEDPAGRNGPYAYNGGLCECH